MSLAISWGVKSLDELLGGIHFGSVTTFYGDTTSGKTTLSGYVAIARIAKYFLEKSELSENARFYILDGDGGWDPDRASSVWERHGLDSQEIKDRIVLKEVSEFEEQHKYILNELPKRIEGGEKPLALIADSMTAIYRRETLRDPENVRKRLEMLCKMDIEVGKLRRLAVEYNCPVFITTWQSSPISTSAREEEIKRLMREHSLSRAEAEQLVPESGMELLGGKGMISFSRFVVRLSIPQEGSPLREASLVKSRDLPTGRSVSFYLCEAGVSDVKKKEVEAEKVRRGRRKKEIGKISFDELLGLSQKKRQVTV